MYMVDVCLCPGRSRCAREAIYLGRLVSSCDMDSSAGLFTRDRQPFGAGASAGLPPRSCS